MTNKELLDKYPWLTPSNRFSEKFITDCAGPTGEEGYWPGSPLNHPTYNYEYTELDKLPEGWRIAFGDNLCKEMNDEIITWPLDIQKHFRIRNIENEWARLQIDMNYGTETLHKIISKYELISKFTCVLCGAEAEWVARWSYNPYCDKCIHKIYEEDPNDLIEEDCINIDKFYAKGED